MMPESLLHGCKKALVEHIRAEERTIEVDHKRYFNRRRLDVSRGPPPLIGAVPGCLEKGRWFDLVHYLTLHRLFRNISVPDVYRKSQ